VLLRSDPSADEVVADGVRQRQVVVSRGGDVAVLDDGVVDVPAERLLDVRHVLDDGDASDADLLASVVIRLHLPSHLVTRRQQIAPTLRCQVVAGPARRPRPADQNANGPNKHARYLQTTLPAAGDLDRPRFQSPSHRPTR